MITLNNSNIDFDFEDESLGSKYSISLSRDTSNLIFKTEGVERMTIMKNGKVGIEYYLDVNGSINAGSYLINGEDISIITSDTSNYVRTTSNILVGRFNDTSNYMKYACNILIGHINDTSNYVKDTCNILIGRINDTSNYVKDTSNYVKDTSNILIGRINDTSNILIGRINVTSNYVTSASNILIVRINDTSNYVRTTSNILVPRFNDTSNILIGRINDTSNYAKDTSNILIVPINDISNYIKYASNILVGRINNTSNYVNNTSNILVGRINNTSNYVKDTSNILIGRINDTSNYVNNTSNILVGRINNTSNYVKTTSNIFVVRIIDSSNYVTTASNILVGRINNTSNYAKDTSNILIGSITDTHNYVTYTCNLLINPSNLLINSSNTSNYIKITNNYMVDLIKSSIYNTWGSNNNNSMIYYNNYNVGIGTNNPVSKLHLYDDTTSETNLTINSTLIPSLSIEFKNFTTNYTIGNYNDKFYISSSDLTSSPTTRLTINSTGFVGMGTTNPDYMLTIYGGLDDTVSFRDTGYYYRSNNTPIVSTESPYSSPSNFCAKFNDSILLTSTGTFLISSDIRIKEDIKNINDDYALQIILAIELKTYKYIDKIKKGDSKVYGFIAQQVKNIIPEAVNIEKSYIPNIMLVADYNNKIIILPYKPVKVTIKIKDKIKCYDSENKLIEIEVSEIINEVSFKIKDLDKEYTNNKIFIYGTYVDDFHTLFKDHIFTLNIGATQELYKQLKKQKDIIKLQEDKMGRLERENDELENKFNKLLEELVLINKQFD